MLPGAGCASAAGVRSEGAGSVPPEGGATVRLAVRVVLPCAAVIVTTLEAVTELVVTEKVALAAPAATVTLAGTLASAAFELDSVTANPPLGAALVSATVPEEGFPPVTAAGLRLTELRLAGGGGGETVKIAVRVVLPCTAVIVALLEAVTALVPTAKLALVAPAATVTLAGTAATALELDSVTSSPPLGAALVSATVPEVPDRKSTRLNSSHSRASRMPSSA